MSNLSANSNKTLRELTSASIPVHSMEGQELSKAPDELPAIERLALDSPATSEQASKAKPDGSPENAAPSLVDKSSSVESRRSSSASPPAEQLDDIGPQY